MTARTHPFQRQPTAAAFQEAVVFGMLRIFTYVILGFGAIIFSIIIYKGAPAVLGSERIDGHFPFLSTTTFFSPSRRPFTSSATRAN